MFLVPGVVVVAVASVAGFHAHWGGLVVLLVLLSLLTAACSATSSALGLNRKQIGGLAAVVTGVQLPLTLLAGILLPLSLGTVGAGLGVTAAAVLALWWGTRSYHRAMT